MAKGSDLIRERIAEALERIATVLETFLHRQPLPEVKDEPLEPLVETPKAEPPEEEKKDGLEPGPPDSDR